MARYRLPKSTEELIRWYEHFLSPLSLIAGFLMDNLVLLRRVDLWTGNAYLFFWLITSAAGIVLLNAIESGKVRNAFLVRNSPFIPVIIQFAFGSLFSAFVSLYSRSASLAISWIFVLALAALLLSNERFTKLYVRLSFQIGIYSIVSFSFLIFFLPVVFHQIGTNMFIAAGLISLAMTGTLYMVVRRVAPTIAFREHVLALRTVIIAFVILNALYFLNVLPPLPLALKSAGVYHAISHNSNGTYTLIGESVPWYEPYLLYNTTYEALPGEDVYVWSAIFAPAGLTTTILHQWQRYDGASKSWVTTDTIGFSINGGRDGGYRGYSAKSNISPGPWRVNVITGTGKLIGRVDFAVASTTTPPLLKTTQQ
jgi:hypothetical protein